MLRKAVADASAIGEYLLRTDRAPAIEKIVEDPDVDVHVPHLCDVELIAALRRALRNGTIDVERAGQALEAYLDLPLIRHRHVGLLERALELRENFSAYDAIYVALAEILDAHLLTEDAPLGRAVRRHTALMVLPVV